MIRHDLVLAAPQIDLSRPKGSLLDVVMLQFHVISASAWLVTAALIAIMGVPRLRRVPSAMGLHALQVKRELILSLVWGMYSLALSTGTYLLFKQAAYDPPLSGSDWHLLKGVPYGVPYFYALYGKIILFLLMGLATVSLTSKAKRASKASEDAGGPVDEAVGSDDRMWLDEQAGSGGLDSSSYIESSVQTARTTSQTRTQEPVVTGGWISVTMLLVGSLGIAVCVTLIKYFHELSKAAVLYYRITHPGT